MSKAVVSNPNTHKSVTYRTSSARIRIVGSSSKCYCISSWINARSHNLISDSISNKLLNDIIYGKIEELSSLYWYLNCGIVRRGNGQIEAHHIGSQIVSSSQHYHVRRGYHSERVCPSNLSCCCGDESQSYHV